MKTKIFCDSADLEIIKKLNNNSLVSGFTTKPSLIRLVGAKDYKKNSFYISTKKLEQELKYKTQSTKNIIEKYLENLIWN